MTELIVAERRKTARDVCDWPALTQVVPLQHLPVAGPTDRLVARSQCAEHGRISPGSNQPPLPVSAPHAARPRGGRLLQHQRGEQYGQPRHDHDPPGNRGLSGLAVRLRTGRGVVLFIARIPE
ncbi:hypothetical protein scyTo_0022547 [Scyliorhinus torazame]|uniref:Uncharacterized protein n=1 Tax=Scyliorhinus torazame TaxID=75743 RepID=A0A401Q8G9_SCYTO|nr:hypothetical protein [Scyliorhinus torazame]